MAARSHYVHGDNPHLQTRHLSQGLEVLVHEFIMLKRNQKNGKFCKLRETYDSDESVAQYL